MSVTDALMDMEFWAPLPLEAQVGFFAVQAPPRGGVSEMVTKLETQRPRHWRTMFVICLYLYLLGIFGKKKHPHFESFRLQRLLIAGDHDDVPISQLSEQANDLVPQQQLVFVGSYTSNIRLLASLAWSSCHTATGITGALSSGPVSLCFRKAVSTIRTWLCSRPGPSDPTKQLMILKIRKALAPQLGVRFKSCYPN